MIADRGYDSDRLRRQLAQRGIELIAPHRGNRSKPPTQDGRALRRYRRRWIIERTFAWLGNYRRLVVRYDRSLTIYQTFFHIACFIAGCTNSQVSLSTFSLTRRRAPVRWTSDELDDPQQDADV